MSAVTCPSCNTPAPPGAIFCDHCGYDLRTVTPASSKPMPPAFLAPGEAESVVCPMCQHPNVAGAIFCENCGAQLSGAKPAPVAPLEYEPPAPSVTAVDAAPVPPGPAPVDAPPPAPTPVGSVIGRLLISESKVSLPIPPGKQVVVIGREDPVSGVFPDIDLDPHGGHEGGVGRRHAQLLWKDGRVYLEDLESVNGTAVNRQRLPPNQPQVLNSGDEIRLGKMALIYYS